MNGTCSQPSPSPQVVEEPGLLRCPGAQSPFEGSGRQALFPAQQQAGCMTLGTSQGLSFPLCQVGLILPLLPDTSGDPKCPYPYSWEVSILFFMFLSEFLPGSSHMPDPAQALGTWWMFSPELGSPFPTSAQTPFAWPCISAAV